MPEMAADCARTSWRFKISRCASAITAKPDWLKRRFRSKRGVPAGKGRAEAAPPKTPVNLQ